jgi:hypothetical protein
MIETMCGSDSHYNRRPIEQERGDRRERREIVVLWRSAEPAEANLRVVTF